MDAIDMAFDLKIIRYMISRFHIHCKALNLTKENLPPPDISSWTSKKRISHICPIVLSVE